MTARDVSILNESRELFQDGCQRSLGHTAAGDTGLIMGPRVICRMPVERRDRLRFLIRNADDVSLTICLLLHRPAIGDPHCDRQPFNRDSNRVCCFYGARCENVGVAQGHSLTDARPKKPEPGKSSEMTPLPGSAGSCPPTPSRTRTSAIPAYAAPGIVPHPARRLEFCSPRETEQPSAQQPMVEPRTLTGNDALAPTSATISGPWSTRRLF